MRGDQVAKLRGALNPVKVTVANLVRYGIGAPWWAARIWVDPRHVTDHVPGGAAGSTARVRSGDWDLRARPLAEHPKIASAIRRWRDGLTWEGAGAYDLMADLIARDGVHDGCRDLDDVRSRLSAADAMFAQVVSEGRLRRSWTPHVEPDGVVMHVGRAGVPIFGGGGCHRLAAAIVADLDRIPCKLGLVHAEALEGWKALR